MERCSLINSPSRGKGRIWLIAHNSLKYMEACEQSRVYKLNNYTNLGGARQSGSDWRMLSDVLSAHKPLVPASRIRSGF